MDNLLYLIIVGIIAGWLAGQFTKGSGFGLIGNLLIGVVGALVGGFLFGLLGLKATGLAGQIVMSTAGAVALLWAIGYVKRK